MNQKKYIYFCSLSLKAIEIEIKTRIEMNWNE
jgi:hypothetical protein